MKLLVLFLCIGFHVMSALAEFERPHFSENAINLTIVEEIIANKFSDSKGRSYIDTAEKNIRFCTLNLTVAPPDDPVKDHDKFCEFFKKSSYPECLKNYLIDIARGLEVNEMYLPYALLNAYHTGVEELCGPDGFSNSEYLFNTLNLEGRSDNVCVMETIYVNLYFNGTCVSDLNIFKDLDEGVFNLNKKDICSDLVYLQSCLTQLTNEFCPGEYSRLFDLIFIPFIEECGYTKHFMFKFF